MKQPHEFARRILVCVAGVTPQVVTETIYALAVKRNPSFVPTEVHLISSSEGIERAQLMLLSEGKGYLRRLREDYGLPEIRLDRSRMHVIRDGHGQELADIRSQADNAAAADAICALLAELSADDEAALHVSIAGGRKTMGYYLGYAVSLFGRAQDRLSHVLVSPDYENLGDFFYPVPEPDKVILLNRANKPLDAALAHVDLAEIPFVRLRGDVPESLLRSPRFTDVVDSASKAREESRLQVLIRERAIECNGRRVDLSPQSFTFYAWLAERCWYEVADGGLVAPTEFNDPESTLRRGLDEVGKRAFPNPMESGSDQWRQWDSADFGSKNKEWIYQRFNDLKSRLTDALGPTGARPFVIQSVSLGGNRKGYRLSLLPEQIELVE